MPSLRKRSYLVLCSIVISTLLLAACGIEELPQSTFSKQGYESEQILELFWPIFWMALAVFVVVNGVLLASIVRYRRRPNDGIPVQLHGNTRIELAWTIAPALIVVVIAVLTFRTQGVLERNPENPLNVTVTGHQWWWEFEYPEYNFVTANELMLPLNRDVLFTLRSADVIHSFHFPRLSGTTDAIPGHDNKVVIRPQEVIRELVRGHCKEFCGGTHAMMAMHVGVLPPEEFETWAELQQSPAAVPAGISQADASVPPAVGATVEATIEAVATEEQATGDEVAATTVATVFATANAATTATPTASSPEALGYQLFQTKGCVGCHAIQGYPGAVSRVGPDLTHVASRANIVAGWLPNTDENMRRWLRDPNDVKPENVMGAVIKRGTLKDNEVEALTAYLRTLE